ncbi:hypothetical protein BDQ17DRAFT_1391561 [Cyathus striatus]|nr:hypothetical protein BDQ17DRAFT_1391561 [Cyathus striatus]
MPLLRPPTLATTIMICLVLFTFSCRASAAENEHINLSHMTTDTQPQLVCTPFGTCEPCPEDSLHEPFCQPFGNRRLMHCQNVTSSIIPGQTEKQQQGDIPHSHSDDFYEFVACNVLFSAIAIFVVLARSRRLQIMQARQLAARIGLARGGAR